MMTKTQFQSDVNALKGDYDRDNAWFGFTNGGNHSWSKGSWDEYVEAAWLLYKNAATNQLQRILLGDTKIRGDRELILNFGLAANSTVPQEAGDKKMVEDLMKQRSNTAQNSAFKTPIEIMGPGSILSAVRWSPLLNDALMLGGIQARQSFHLALNVDEQAEWKLLESGQAPQTEAERRKAAFENKRGMFGAPAQAVAKTSERRAKDLWLKFIHKVPRVIWERGTPRVFARELLGLKLFGYKPQFDINGLGFFPSGAGQLPTFANYLAGLRAEGYTQGTRPQLLGSISEFLFGHSAALSTLVAP
jgi:hypothetical protein